MSGRSVGPMEKPSCCARRTAHRLGLQSEGLCDGFKVSSDLSAARPCGSPVASVIANVQVAAMPAMPSSWISNRMWWKAARPLSGEDSAQADLRSGNGAGNINAVSGWNRTLRLIAPQRDQLSSGAA